MKPTEKLPADLVALQRRIHRWRKARKKLGPMPERLWSAAVRQARQYGVVTVTRTLGLGHNGLKKRLERTKAHRVDASGACGLPARPAEAAGGPSRFVELHGLAPQTGREATIELFGSDGARMVICLPTGSQIDADALCAAFLERTCCS